MPSIAHTPPTLNTLHPPRQAALQRAVDEGGFSFKLLGQELAGPLTWALLAGTVFALFRADLVMQMLGRKRAAPRGRWVYDRSLGGKKVRGRQQQPPCGSVHADGTCHAGSVVMACLPASSTWHAVSAACAFACREP
jgi:hypothetical protein